MITHSPSGRSPIRPIADAGRYRALAKVAKALAEPLRLAILDNLRDEERCVHDIARAVGAERSNVSRHLGVLSDVGILTSRKQGLQVFYSLRTTCILNVFTCIRGVLESDLAEAQRTLCQLPESTQ